MSSFGAISHLNATLNRGVWRPAFRRPSPPGTGLDRAGRRVQSRSLGGGTFVLGMALLGFPFPEVIRRHRINTEVIWTESRTP
jgi:hypothetical protein